MRIGENGVEGAGGGPGGSVTQTPAASGPTPVASPSPPSFDMIPDHGDLDNFTMEGAISAGNSGGEAIREAPIETLPSGGTAPAVPAQAAPGEQPVQLQQPQRTEAQPPVAQTPPAPQQPPAAQQPKQTMFERLRSGRNELIPAVAQQEGFRLTEEEIAELDTNPVAALEKAQARTYLNAVTYMHQMVDTALPAMIEQGVQHALQRRAQSQGVQQQADGFLKQMYPAIKSTDQNHVAALARVGAVYRQMNPRATVEQTVKDVGAIVMQQLGLQAQAAAPRSAPAFVPAGGGAPARSQATPPVNPFDGMTKDYD